jgi:UDP-3-O-[3-hydroxymyristoyl] glucosamine N-acyltransferase
MIAATLRIKDVLQILYEEGIYCYYDGEDFKLQGFSSLFRTEPGTLSWSRGNLGAKPACAAVIAPLNTKKRRGIALIRVEDPEYAFAVVLKRYENEEPLTTKGQFDCYIHPMAKIGEHVQIGHGTVIDGRSTIGSGTIIHHNVVIQRTTMGRDCVVQSGTVIGHAGFSRVRHEDKLMRWPHLAGVTIGNRVEICSNVAIHRGVLYDTCIGDDVMIDNLAHIAHGVQIGKRTMITACVEMSGSSEIGEDCWLAPGTIIRNGVKIGNNTLIGMGAVVTKDFGDNLVIMGVPAKEIRKREAS